VPDCARLMVEESSRGNSLDWMNGAGDASHDNPKISMFSGVFSVIELIRSAGKRGYAREEGLGAGEGCRT
jgi:hypothetical protein